jgi:hypothetical protein
MSSGAGLSTSWLLGGAAQLMLPTLDAEDTPKPNGVITAKGMSDQELKAELERRGAKMSAKALRECLVPEWLGLYEFCKAVNCG